MKLAKLHEEFMKKADRPMTFGARPVSPKEAETPILPAERWRRVDNVLVKDYSFRRPEDKTSFVTQLLAYEAEVQHNASLLVTQHKVTVSVSTSNVGVTELDLEYARFADAVFRDLVYAPDTNVSSL